MVYTAVWFYYTDAEITENCALYKPVVSSLYDLVFNSMDRGANDGL